MKPRTNSGVGSGITFTIRSSMESVLPGKMVITMAFSLAVAVMVALAAALSALIALPASASAGEAADPVIAPYHYQNDLALTSGGALWWDNYGFGNPALLGYVAGPNATFTWRGSQSERQSGMAYPTDDDPGPGFAADLDQWSLLAAVPHLGFAVRHDKTDVGSVSDYRVAYALGTRSTSFGASYSFSGGDAGLFGRGHTLGFGALFRPIPYISVGLSGQTSTEGKAKEGVFDVGLRPLGTDNVTVFGDYAIQQDQVFRDGAWSTGAALKVLPGVHLTARYLGTHAFSAGLSIDLGRLGLASQAHYDNNQHRAYNTYSVRAGAYTPNVVDAYLMPERKYLEFDLMGPLKYQRYRWFDKANTLAGLLTAIEAAKNDPRVAGIAINTSAMDANREVAWEVREKLREFKSTGKHVVIYLDYAGIDLYHFASVADKIVMDPMSIMLLEGYCMGRTYLKGTIEKAGLAFDEWRFFTYKSANEALSREGMSEADREQRQRLLDEFYNVAKTEICAARSISGEEFDRMVNEAPIMLAADAVKLGLADTLARWDEIEDVVKSLEGKSKQLGGPGGLAVTSSPRANYGADEGFAEEDRWGDRPQIAVVYALGECAMDTGIKARTLSKVVQDVTDDSAIKAVVFRVDSPGGDALASDIVAAALKKCMDKKPVIVSQGFVAASGGYWISMYSDKIVAAPQTITGSIGVIGGWLYNAGLKERLGMTTDHVQTGNHADLAFGMTMPLIGAQVPDRNLSTDERGMVENLIKTSYKEFVAKVAAGRGMEAEAVDKIGQGRVWPGVDGLENGLVDALGGLDVAIALAKQEAGIGRDEAVALVELPEPEAFNFGMFTPKLIGFAKLGYLGQAKQLAGSWLLGGDAGFEALGSAGPAFSEDASALDHLRFRLEHNGQPMPMIPLEDMDMILGSQVR
ncbi:MAG: signal peptide peptidase SppA [bacterium]